MNKMIFDDIDLSIKDLIDGYSDNQENGVFGYKGKLNIRPAYQREFVYNEQQQCDVIRSVRSDYPLNVMYFMLNDDGTYELLDGQQRILSICRYWDNKYSVLYNDQRKFFHNLGAEEKKQFLNYKLKVYICKGTAEDRKKWFEIINFKGESLTRQELLNAMYSGPWVTDAKRYFSKNGCVAYDLGNDYMDKKVAIRQEIFEQALKWIADKEKIDYEEYMAIHEPDESAEPLWVYFSNVIEWVKATFGCEDEHDNDNYRPEMKKVNWGILYNKYGENTYDATEMESKVSKLMADFEVTKKAGVYEYVFDNDEKHLNLRTFDDGIKRTVYEQQEHKCFICKKVKPYKEMHGDHWKPWSEGGTTVIENCRMLCNECNLKKSAQTM